MILRTAFRCHTEYEWGQHVRIATEGGVSADEIARIQVGPDAPDWDTFDATVLRAVDELHVDNRIGDPTWTALAARFDERQLIKVPMLVGSYHMVAFMLNSLGVQREPGIAGLRRLTATGSPGGLGRRGRYRLDVSEPVAPPSVPTGVDDLSAAWLTTALAPHGMGTVAAVSATAIGTGQVADSVRLTLTWDPPASGPETLVAKVTAADETSRAAAGATQTYEVEVGFYSDLAEALPIRSPRCYHAAFDAETLGYVVLLEDLAPAEQGDQLTGCSPAEAQAALDEIAQLHAPRWGDPSLNELAWLARHSDAYPDELAVLVMLMLPGFIERYRPRLPPEVVDLAERFVPRVASYIRAQEPPFTIVHGDFRVDNLLFGHERVCVVDWQTVALGPGLSDVSYLLGASLPTEARRVEEERLVRSYHQRVTALGVELEWERCWADYRRYTFGGLIMAIIASMIVGRTDRGDDMFVAMAERHGIHALDLESEALIPA